MRLFFPYAIESSLEKFYFLELYLAPKTIALISQMTNSFAPFPAISTCVCNLDLLGLKRRTADFYDRKKEICHDAKESFYGIFERTNESNLYIANNSNVFSVKPMEIKGIYTFQHKIVIERVTSTEFWIIFETVIPKLFSGSCIIGRMGSETIHYFSSLHTSGINRIHAIANFHAFRRMEYTSKTNRLSIHK